MRPVAGALTALGGALILTGWATNVGILTSLMPGFIHTLPNAAVGFVAGGIALLLASESTSPIRRRAFYAATGAMLAIGVLTLFERLTEIDVGIDRILFAETLSAFPYRPIGRFATNSALTLTVASLALLLTGTGNAKRPRAAEWLTLAGLTVALLALVGYLYRVAPLYQSDRAAGMGPFTMTLFLILLLGILFARPQQGAVALVMGNDLGALIARRMLPPTIIAPLVIGALWLRARQAELVSREGGIALVTLFTLVVLVVALLWTADVVRRLDRQREDLLTREAAAREDAERARREAEMANRTKSDFLAVMSHDLRTPLNAISGYVELLQMGIRGPVTTLQLHDLERISTAQRHLIALINDILNFARVEAGSLQFVRNNVAVNPMLEGLEALIAPQVESKGLTYRYVPVDDTLAVIADRDKLEQLLLNLLTNAVKFTPEGGAITLRADAGPGVVHIAVHDTGQGIPADKLQVIFDPFVQVDRRLSSTNDGVGLGLSISRELARGMSGELTVQSEPGRGSTFVVTVPRAA